MSSCTSCQKLEMSSHNAVTATTTTAITAAGQLMITTESFLCVSPGSSIFSQSPTLALQPSYVRRIESSSASSSSASSRSRRKSSLGARSPGGFSTAMEQNTLKSHPSKSAPKTWGAPASPSASTEDTSLEEMSYEDFVYNHYVPLSGLPTPPSGKAHTVPPAVISTGVAYALDPEFHAPAKYLASMVPHNASRAAPSVEELQAVLQRANLKLPVVSLAACILDCLSWRFIRTWRAECCELGGAPQRSETLAIAALCLAMKFFEDDSYPTRYWATTLSEDLISTRSLATTERLLVNEIRFSLHSISAQENIDYHLKQIEACAKEEDDIHPPSSPVSWDSGYQSPARCASPMPLQGF